MCELLALSSSQPARLTFSLHTLAARGGLLGRFHDGWGVAFYEGFDVALYREPRPSADSALVNSLETQGRANFLYADGDALFAHGDRRLQLDRRELVAIRDGVILARASTISAPDRAARADHAL